MAVSKSTINQINKHYHQYSDTVHGIDFYKIPKELKNMYGVSAQDFADYIQLPYFRTNEGKILVNESYPDWELMRDLLLALDRLPDSLLLDICKMDANRWTEGELNNLEGDTVDEMLRKVLYRLIPEIMWAHAFGQN